MPKYDNTSNQGKTPELNLTTPDLRGCGEREEGGLYACVGLGDNGAPIEVFTLDPAIPWDRGPFRAPQFHQRQDGVWDLVMWVGAEAYPYAPDFIEEARRLGISKRVPISNDIDYSRLTPYQSRLILVHPKGRYDGPVELAPEPRDEAVPHIRRGKGRPGCDHPVIGQGCTFALWDLSGGEGANCSGHAVDDHPHDEGLARVTCGSTTYTVQRPVIPAAPDPDRYAPAIIAAIPLSHFEYVSKKNTVPSTVADRLGGNLNHTAVTPK